MRIFLFILLLVPSIVLGQSLSARQTTERLTPPTQLPAVLSVNGSALELKLRKDARISPVRAGRIVYVSPRGTHPATMMIDHGGGLYSVYTTFFWANGAYSKALGDYVVTSDALAESLNFETLVLQILRSNEPFDLPFNSNSSSQENFNRISFAATRFDLPTLLNALSVSVVELDALDADVSITVSHIVNAPLEVDLNKGDKARLLVPIHAEPYRVDARVKGFFSSRPIPSTRLQIDDLKSSFTVVASLTGFETKGSKQDPSSASIHSTPTFLGLDHSSTNEATVVPNRTAATGIQFQGSGSAVAVTSAIATQTDQQTINEQTRLAEEIASERKRRAALEEQLAAEIREREKIQKVAQGRDMAAELEAERKRLKELEIRRIAEIDAERQKRQELETKLADEAKERERLAAEVKERERLLTESKERERPQVALRNERRLALVIGNSSYKVSPLDNPANDANDVAESLKKFGFQTTLVRNATLGQMREATRKFADQLPSADVALIYFAGHGIESNRKNYMIPVNADLKFEYELADQGYDAGIWLEMLESIKSNNADRVNIVILDACRNNSLIGSRNLGRGLGKMDAPSGTFLAYSTAPGKVAADGGRGERNSPFTKHLIRAMQQPNQPIEEVFKEVRRNVGKETNGAQVPWESTSLTGFFTFRQGR